MELNFTIERDEAMNKEEKKTERAEFMKVFADNLGRLRTERNLTQEELAEIAGVSSSVISQYENRNKLASTLYAKQLATALDVSLDELCGESDTARYIKKLEDSLVHAILTVIRLCRFHVQFTDNDEILLSMPHDETGYSSTEIKKFIKEYMVIQEFKEKNADESGIEMTSKLLEHIAVKYNHIPDHEGYKSTDNNTKKNQSKEVTD